MYAVYGTKRKYENNVVRNGIDHPSAAYFLVPEKQGTIKLQTTLMCAIYHAIGITTLQKSIIEDEKLSASIEKDTGIVLAIFQINDAAISVSGTETYYVGNVQTYPYVKVHNVGHIPMEYIGSLYIEEHFFDDNMKDDSNGLRFFQKKNGKLQYIDNCNMQKLLLCCSNAALINATLFADLLRG